MQWKRLSALAVVAGLALAGCGADEDTSAENGAQAAGNGVDRAFVAAMIPHHESAVEMAKLAQQRRQSKFVDQLAEDIIRTQNAEITKMRGEDAALAEASVEKGDLGVPDHMTGMDGDSARLRDARPFDPEFLRMMIPHHEGAVTMARAELAKGSDPELRQLARDIITAQQREIRAMRRQLGDEADGTESQGKHSQH